MERAQLRSKLLKPNAKDLMLLTLASASFSYRCQSAGASCPSSPWPMSSKDAATLRQVVLVHRHGARFPTKPTGKADIAWPIRTQFWESYKGHLTPVGSSQLQDGVVSSRMKYDGEKKH